MRKPKSDAVKRKIVRELYRALRYLWADVLLA
jgi:hypothetical protein